MYSNYGILKKRQPNKKTNSETLIDVLNQDGGSIDLDKDYL